MSRKVLIATCGPFGTGKSVQLMPIVEQMSQLGYNFYKLNDIDIYLSEECLYYNHTFEQVAIDAIDVGFETYDYIIFDSTNETLERRNKIFGSIKTDCDIILIEVYTPWELVEKFCTDEDNMNVCKHSFFNYQVPTYFEDAEYKHIFRLGGTHGLLEQCNYVADL